MKPNIVNDEAFLQELPGAGAACDRRAFLMRSPVTAAAAVLTGCTTEQKAAQMRAAPSPQQQT